MCSLSGNNKIILKLSNKRSQHSKTWIIYNISKSYDCASHCFFGYLQVLQGAKKVSLTACHLGKLKLTFTSPNIISTSPKNVLMSRLISQFFCKLNSSKNFTCPSGKLITEFTSPIAKSTSPGLSDTTFFAPCIIIIIIIIIYWTVLPISIELCIETPCWCTKMGHKYAWNFTFAIKLLPFYLWAN